MANGPAVALALGAGAASAVQVAVNGTLGRRIGTLEATAFSVSVSFVLVVVVLLVSRGLGGYSGSASALYEPVWLWLGGVLGLVIVGTITFSGPRLGALATLALLIVGQLVVGAAVDRFGWLGAPQIGLSWTRVAGIVLLGIGTVLALDRGR